MEYGFRALMEFLNQRNITEADSPQNTNNSVPIPKPRPSNAPLPKPRPLLDTETVKYYRDYILRPHDGTFTASDGNDYQVPKIRGGYPKSAHVPIYQPPK